jgi:acetyl esterase/lipase
MKPKLKPRLATGLLASVVLVHSLAAQTPTFPDVTYATVGPSALKLDLYIPSTGTAPYPTLIYIHGGGWQGGSKFPIPGLASFALQHGFAVAAVDYRLTSQAAQFAPESVTFPAQIFDVKGAVRRLRANAATYALNPTKFAAFGTSAGGHLTALLATSGGVAALEGDVGGNLAFPSRVGAGVDYFGPTDLLQIDDDVETPPGSGIDHDAENSPESKLLGWFGTGQGVGDIKLHLTDPTPPYPALVALANDANPITWVDASDPPLLIGHGTDDTSVPVNQSSRLSAALFAANVPHDFRAIPFGTHGNLGPAIDAVAFNFLVQRLFGTAPPDAGTPFCAGDGSASACPCGNTTLPGANLGCRHSRVVGGNLRATGVASISNDTLVLRGDSMLNSSALYFQGDGLVSGGMGIAFDDGLRCAGNVITRLGLQMNTSGWSQYPLNGQPSVSTKGSAFAGQTLYYQCWYRDTANWCTAATTNLTNALAITWSP